MFPIVYFPYKDVATDKNQRCVLQKRLPISANSLNLSFHMWRSDLPFPHICPVISLHHCKQLYWAPSPFNWRSTGKLQSSHFLPYPKPPSLKMLAASSSVTESQSPGPVPVPKSRKTHVRGSSGGIVLAGAGVVPVRNQMVIRKIF